MIYALPTYCGADSADVPSFATADIGPGQARYYLELMNRAADLARDYPKALWIQIFDCLPRWYNYPDTSDAFSYIVDTVIDNEQVAILDDIPDLDGADESCVETVVIEACGGEISWRGYVKYSNVEVSTMALSRAQIEEAL